MMRDGNMLDDGQPQTGATHGTTPGLVHPVESFKDALPMLLLNSRPLIRYADLNKILNQRNALLYALDGQTPTSSQKNELDIWTSDFIDVSNEVIEVREKTIALLLPLVQHFYEELSQSTTPIGVSYERSWSGELSNALNGCLNDDLFRRHTTTGFPSTHEMHDDKHHKVNNDQLRLHSDLRDTISLNKKGE